MELDGHNRITDQLSHYDHQCFKPDLIYLYTFISPDYETLNKSFS